MSQTNVELARRWMDEVWNKRIEATIEEMLAPEAIGHSEGNPDFHGIAAFREYRGAYLAAFPDLQIEVQDAIGSGDEVAVRWRVRGSHGGDGLGIASTGKAVDFWGITWLRLSGGQIVEGWDAWNQGGLMQRLQVR